jgi:hypothetical protein
MVYVSRLIRFAAHNDVIPLGLNVHSARMHGTKYMLCKLVCKTWAYMLFFFNMNAVQPSLHIPSANFQLAYWTLRTPVLSNTCHFYLLIASRKIGGHLRFLFLSRVYSWWDSLPTTVIAVYCGLMSCSPSNPRTTHTSSHTTSSLLKCVRFPCTWYQLMWM